MKKIFGLCTLAVLCALLFSGCAGKTNQPYNENLIKNGGFETVEDEIPENWTLDRYDTTMSADNCKAAESANAPEGKYVLCIESEDFNDARFIQEVSVQGNAYYKLSAKVKTESTEQRTNPTGANIGFLQTYCRSEFVQNDTDWTEITLYGKTEKNMKSVTVALRLGYYSADCKGIAYFDDVRFERVKEVPEGVDVASIETFEFSSDTGNKTTGSASNIKLQTVTRGIAYFAFVMLFVALAMRYKEKFTPKTAYIIIGAALVIRLIASVMYTGFKVDINCFAAWGQRMASVGPFAFYADNYFCDYPPLYMLVLGLISLVSPSVSLAQGVGLMFLKLPAIICDIIAAVLIVKKAKKYAGENVAAILGALYAILPTAILNSAVWGQVDSILVLFMMLSFMLIDEDKFGPSVIVYSVGMLFKPQAVLFGPVMLFAAAREFGVIYDCFKQDNGKEGSKRLANGFGGLVISILLFLVLSLAMKNGQSISWLWEKYMGTFSSYDYATLSSFGLMGLLGGQWVKNSTASPVGITFGTLGTLLTLIIIFSAVVLFVLAWKKRKRIPTQFFWLFGAYVLAGVVTVSARTHERYIFPVILMLIFSFAYFGDRRLLNLSIGYAFINFVNTAVVLYLYEGTGQYMKNKEPLMIVGSVITVALFAYLAYVTFEICMGREKKEKEKPEMAEVKSDTKTENGRLNALFARRKFTLPRVKGKDIIICLLITALYAAVAFTKLGDTKAAQSQWHTGVSQSYALCDLGEETLIDGISINSSSAGRVKVYTSLDKENYTLAGETVLSYYSSGEWTDGEINAANARYVKLVPAGAVKINEVVLLSGGKTVTPKSTEQEVNPVDSANTADAMFDAQESFGVQYSKPETAWASGGTYRVTLENGGSVSGIAGFPASPEVSGTLEIKIPGDITVGYLDVSGSAWCRGEILGDADGLTGDTYEIFTNEGHVSLNELVFLDENGEPMKIKSVTDESGNAAMGDILNAFDEQDKYTEYMQVKEETDTGKGWNITSNADWVVADFGETKHIDRGYFYLSVCTGNFVVYYSNDGINWSDGERHNVEPGQLYYWHGLPSDGGTYADLNARYVAVCAESKNMRIIEMGFFENKGDEKVIKIKEVRSAFEGENGGNKIFDEQALVPTRPSYMNSMYFDEIYHARTAYENLNGLSIYEWTHPPLGKDLMSLSISVFGMTPFGWRFAGTLAGVLMVPAMFFIGLLMFRKTTWAAMLAAIMSLDGMHFVQTRLATIDSYGVLFIILMFLFMYWYYSISFYDVPLKKTFLPLGLCGLSFGLGAASKWICLYAGAGLAVIFFITLFRRYGEYRLAKQCVKDAEGEEKKYLQKIVNTFPLYTAETILFCIGVFIIVPLIIYCVSYYPYFRVAGETRPWYKIILDNQSAMFNYHSKLQATHPYQSDWYTWPVIYRPMYYYAGKELTDPSKVECISAFGNPIIWYMGLAATVLGLAQLVRRIAGAKQIKAESAESGFLKIFSSGDENLADWGERDTRLLLFLALGVACNLLPWVGISRCIFIYHYFATVPFIMMFTVYMFRNICRKNKKAGAVLIGIFMLAALILFIMFKPVWTGTAVSKEYVRTYLRWFKSWVFGV